MYKLMYNVRLYNKKCEQEVDRFRSTKNGPKFLGLFNKWKIYG